ncbi:MAG: DUF3311 domain-containing protein [Gemmatimonadetes bacterium]|nr:DUF3311 domain-containing protein [Gemmatimonadota bacterium]NIR81079.1 DUF3311 domain-containing protein [Gemmatimonadota bacterium]NIT89897.1 DUF3311 domain-containing protein [Gemmatimonadota bacterium]NIU33696.1 DUF3311 domain-containing protein [Gemmatimonadota bacterium]NIU37939.1 DUF3311 domain-containing protein [Gemmatimonadota bacterium]
MSGRRVRWGVAIFFLAYVAGVTWPGAVPLNRIRPLVLGLPLSMVWVALWLVLSFGALVLLDRFETREEDERSARDRGPGPGGTPDAGRRGRAG